MNREKIKTFLTQKTEPWRPIPFWSWNGRLESGELFRQIQWMKENGMGGFFMHARSGLETEYLSEEWMDCIRDCAALAEKEGLDAWIYDENGWPSGFAGGKLLENEADRDQYLMSEVGEFDPQATVSYLCDGEELIRTDRPLAGRQYLNVYIRTSVSNADILNRSVVDRFIALTHENYKERFGEAFSQKIRGFFTDEPQYQRSHTAYTRVLAPYFKAKYGTDILDGLGLLFVQKRGYRAFRYRYWSAMQELMLHAFAENIYRWCLANKVEFTGHYFDENCLGGQVMCCGGVMPFYEYMTMPGIDWLDRDAENELPVRQLTSAAAQLGKERTITESFGCCGWEAGPKDVKRITDFQFLNGISVLCHHLVPYTERGLRKHDHPAHYSEVNPWVRTEFSDFNLYAARLGKLISQSREKLSVAVLLPVRTAYFDFQREEEDYGVGALEESFRAHCRALSSAGICYHFLDETLLERHGFTEGRHIGCGKCRYDTLVLTDAATMSRATEALVRQFAENGGKILMMGEKPRFLEAEPFDYPYLKNTCTIEELCEQQPFAIKERNRDLYYTYREIGETPFIMVQNASRTKTHTQTFRLGKEIRSFRKWDLITMEETVIPLTLTLEPGESAVLFPSSEEAKTAPERQEYLFELHEAQVDFEENQYVIDSLRYSTDGEKYSKHYPYAGLFQKLLEERYEGELYLKYEFTLNEIPLKLVLNAEDCGAVETTLNGTPFSFTGNSPYEKALLRADITALCRKGKNELVFKLFWHQNESVYYALFGENVTESLKNCIVYDTELQPVFLSGGFGVYSESGFSAGADPGYVYAKDFTIGPRPRTVTEPVTDGFPFFAGILHIRQKVKFETGDILLRIGGNWHVAQIRVNGRYAGKLVYGNTLDISRFAVRGENELEIDFTIGNRNLLGPHHFCGEKENFTANPWRFQLTGSWRDGESEFYADRYNLWKLDCAVGDLVEEKRDG